MRQLTAILPLILCFGLLAGESPELILERRIELPGVEGRIDHLSIDLKGKRLFVAALGNGSIEVLDLKAGRRTQSLAGLDEPQGVVWMPELSLLGVSCGGDGCVHLFGGDLLEAKDVLKLGADADNVRWAAALGRLYVGYAEGAIGILDPAARKVIGKIEVSGHPEGFQADAAGKRIYVNVPPQRVEVLDVSAEKRVATWKLEEAGHNFPLALDESSARLFVGCRSPARILVLETAQGRVTASLDGPGDVDDLFFDAQSGRLYAAGGAGSVFVYQRTDADHYTLLAQVPTAPGARTALYVSELERLFVAAPRRDGKDAAVLEYRIVPQK